jgi:uncharacterized protein YkwD
MKYIMYIVLATIVLLVYDITSQAKSNINSISIPLDIEINDAYIKYAYTDDVISDINDAYNIASNTHNFRTDISSRKQILKLFNIHRAKKGLNPLEYDESLEPAAKIQVLDNYINKKHYKHVNELNKKRKQEFYDSFHINTNPDYKYLSDRLSITGINRGYSSEICLASEATVSDINQYIASLYYDSPPHNNTILTPDFKRMGIYNTFTDGIFYNTIVFTN